MSHEIFRQGGPHNIRRTGNNEYSLSIEMPTDAMGMTARECPSSECSPGAFKIKYGTGLKGEQEQAFCPYCRGVEEPNDFMTSDQERYVTDIVTDQAAQGVERMMKDALGLGSNGKKQFGGDLISMEMSMEPQNRPPVRRPWEEQLRRDVTCPGCTLEHAVYGLAVWCPDCGEDIFMTHVETECQVLRAMLNDVERRSNELGPRVAARDIENGLEDVVSILEASMKALTCRRLLTDGKSPEDADVVMKKQVRNRFQGYEGGAELMGQLFSIDLAAALAAPEIDRFKGTLEKRHPITHNLGIVDRKYLEKVRTGEAEGRDVNLDEREVLGAIETALTLIRHAHAGLFTR